jgi:hypothetical protein
MRRQWGGESQHLQILRSAGPVVGRKGGLFVTHKLATPKVQEYVGSLCTLAKQQLAEVEQIRRRFLAGKEGLEPVDKAALVERIRAGAVTVLDVCPGEDYRAGYTPGALSVPLAE